MLHHLMQWKFSDVQNISTEKLAHWLQQPSKNRPVLLDVREREEYAVSHLKQARHTPPNTEIKTLQERYRPETVLVLYCSVGYRSSLLVQRLQKAGFHNVYNLEGSIFQWANEGRELYQNKAKTTKVHPFNRMWGTLLKKRYHAKVSER